MDTDTNRCTTSRRPALGLTLAAGLTLAWLGGAAAAAADADDLPTYEQCQLIDHPAAADLGPLLPTHHEPAIGVQAVLLGEREVGTDCSIFDLPADQPV